MDEFEKIATLPKPTARRPLLGLTILLVEDSRYACDAIRLMCLRSGARIRRADCLASARRHLQVYRPSVAMIDLGLPDGSGAELINDLAKAQPRISVILGTSGDDDARAVALRAGADGFLSKPIESLVSFQQAILDRLPVDSQPPSPRALADIRIRPDPIAYRDDMLHASEIIASRAGEAQIDYLAQFLSGVANSAEDRVLASAVRALAQERAQGRSVTKPLARLSGLINERAARDVAI